MSARRSRHFGRLLSATALGYLAGTLPSADIAARLASHGRVQLREGGGNPGALNAAQQLGVRWGAAVLVADAAKGAAGAVLGRRVAGASGGYAGATAAIAGHIAPLWNGFRGGKGVATSAGACLAVFPAYFPLDATVAGLGAMGSRNAETTVRISAALCSAAAVWWWYRKWPNAWGPPPTLGLPGFAIVSSAMILTKFASARVGTRAYDQPQAQIPSDEERPA